MFFICFNTNNKNYINSELGKMGFANVDIRYGYEMNNDLFNTQPDIVKNTLKTIGEALIANEKAGKPDWDKKRIEEAALGYNDARQMVILKSSVPTYTITPFWLGGKIGNGIEWSPLFTRTTKSDNNTKPECSTKL